jgi:hypothetical protein
MGSGVAAPSKESTEAKLAGVDGGARGNNAGTGDAASLNRLEAADVELRSEETEVELDVRRT